MLWIILIIALVAIVGIGTLLEAAFWTLLIVVAAVVIVGLAVARAVGR